MEGLIPVPYRKAPGISQIAHSGAPRPSGGCPPRSVRMAVPSGSRQGRTRSLGIAPTAVRTRGVCLVEVTRSVLAEGRRASPRSEMARRSPSESVPVDNEAPIAAQLVRVAVVATASRASVSEIDGEEAVERREGKTVAEEVEAVAEAREAAVARALDRAAVPVLV